MPDQAVPNQLNTPFFANILVGSSDRMGPYLNVSFPYQYGNTHL